MTAPLSPAAIGALPVRAVGAGLFARRALLVVAAAAAVTAVLAGLARLGVSVAWGPSFTAVHGPLFVLGVFGTVISLERAVALARPWGLAAPAAFAVAGVAMLSTDFRRAPDRRAGCLSAGRSPLLGA